MQNKRVTRDEIKTIDQLNNIGHKNWEDEFFSPLKIQSYLFATQSENKFVGCEGYVDYHLMHNSERQLTHRSERTIVDPDYRGKGIFERLITECDSLALQDGSQFVWGATGALKPFVRAGFNSYTGFRSYVFFPIGSSVFSKLGVLVNNPQYLNPFHLYKIWKSKNLTNLRAVLSLIALLKPISRKGNAQISFTEPDFAVLNNFQKNHFKEYYQLELNENLFEWLKTKGKEYDFKQVMLKNEIVGNVVVRKKTTENFLTIMDINLYNISISEVLSELSKSYKKQNAASFFFALNNKNAVHQNYLEQLKKDNVLVKNNFGSFVIKPLHNKSITISDLMLTDLWLEL